MSTSQAGGSEACCFQGGDGGGDQGDDGGGRVGQQGFDLSTSSRGRGAATTTRVAMRTTARAWASAPSWKQ
eukprot:scaffold138117_cov160-Phaeocystis_antarctica.AAC.1